MKCVSIARILFKVQYIHGKIVYKCMWCAVFACMKCTLWHVIWPHTTNPTQGVYSAYHMHVKTFFVYKLHNKYNACCRDKFHAIGLNNCFTDTCLEDLVEKNVKWWNIWYMIALIGAWWQASHVTITPSSKCFLVFLFLQYTSEHWHTQLCDTRPIIPFKLLEKF